MEACQSERSIMDVTLRLRSLDAVGYACVNKPIGWDTTTEATQEEVAFENARALTTALDNSPAAREEMIRRATELVGNVNYPPPETIRMISHLLAMQMESDRELV